MFQEGNQEWLKREQVKPFKSHLRMELAALAQGQQAKHPRGSLRWQAQRLCLEGSLNSALAIRDTLDGKPAQEIISSGDNAQVVQQLREWLAWTRMPEVLEATASPALPGDIAHDTKLLECKANQGGVLLTAQQPDPLAEANAD